MICRLTVSALVLAVLGHLSAGQWPDLSKVEVTIESLAPGLHMLTGAGGNIVLSTGADGAFVVDDQLPGFSDKVEAAIGRVTDKPIRFVVNTHWHADHAGGNEYFGKAGAVIVAHENVRKRMSVDQFNDFFKATTPAAPAVALPVVTFADSVSLHVNGQEVRVVHVAPAHTDSDSIVHFVNANVVHMGDLFFNRWYPFIDVTTGGSADGVIAAVDRALTLVNEQTKIIPGHGPVGDKTTLRAYRDMLATVRDRVVAMKQHGRTLKEVQAANPAKEFDATWGNGFLKADEFLAVVYAAVGTR